MRNKFIHCVFEDIANEFPNRTALLQGDSSLSYHELNLLANKMAHLLLGKKAQGSVAGLFFSNKQTFVPALLAVLKAGAIMLPLDYKAPANYLEKLMNSAQPAIIIADTQGSKKLDEEGLLINFTGGLIILDENLTINYRQYGDGHSQLPDNLSDAPHGNPECSLTPEDGCGMFFVSTPSGFERIMINCKSLTHAIVWQRKTLINDAIHRLSSFADIHTDAFLREIFLALASGSTLCLQNNESNDKLLLWLQKAAISIAHFSVWQFKQLLKDISNQNKQSRFHTEQLPMLDIVFISGESLYTDEVSEWFNSQGSRTKLVYLYTIPEITLHKLFFPVLPVTGSWNQKIPVGKPVGNTMEMILNSRDKLCKPGEVGALYIKTPFLSMGYKENESLNKACFLQNPLHHEYDDIVCKTGHLAFYNADGDIELAGAIDDQLNINGVRIYPREIENHIKQYDGVTNAVVFTTENAEGQKILAAECMADTDLNDIKLKTFLELLLPSSMVPDIFNQVKAIPLLVNGEVNRALYRKSKPVAGSIITPAYITTHRRPRYIPLSFGQQRLWFIDRLEGSIQYHIPLGIRIKGNLDPEAFEYALQAIINRHEVLRTVIEENDGVPYQRIIDKDQWQLTMVVKPGYDNNKEGLHQYIKESIARPFDLSKDYMLRVELIELNKYEYVLLIVLHHISSDSWSRLILEAELAEFYNSYKEKRAPVLLPLPVQYADYSIWQRGYMQREMVKHKLTYWRKQLKNVPPLNLPCDFVRPAHPTGKTGSVSIEIDQNLSQKLQLFSRQQTVTLFTTLLTTFKVLLYRYTNQLDICIGTAMWERQNEQLTGLIGSFINMLALRSNLEGNPKFSDLLQSVKQTTLDAFENQEIPFEKVVEEVVARRDMSRNPLFQVIFGMQHQDDRTYQNQLGDIVLLDEPIAGVESLAGYELNVSVWPGKEGLRILAQYDADLFTSETIHRMLQHYKELLNNVLEHKDQVISRLAMLPADDAALLIQTFNNTDTSYPTERILIDLFSEQALKTPDNIAVKYKDQQLTYRELAERSNQLARYLQILGVTTETLVPLCTDRCIEMQVAILGILKSGAAYVPIDPGYPYERISYILKDTGAKVIITTSDRSSVLQAQEGQRLIMMDTDWSVIAKEDKASLSQQSRPGNVAYVIYTSGSTGIPKGVMIEHKGLYNRILWAQEYFKLESKDVFLQKTNFCFDVSVWELLWPMITGSKLVFAEPGLHKDIAYLKSVVNKEAVTIMHFVPYALNGFLEEIHNGEVQSLKKVICSGEALSPATVDVFKEKLKSVELYNLYGPTEASIDVSYWHLGASGYQSGMNIPIGRPVANTQLYILDKENQVCPVGVIGEICIGGVQLARGYLNNEGLTKEKFVPHPFKPGARIYRTSDLGRWLPDGNIEFLGRMDDQVKIKGHRIEPGEIETALHSIEGVKQAVILAKDDKQGNKRLVGYLVINGKLDENLLEKKLLKSLPEYMVPRLWIKLEELPFTSNGKVDRKALPDPDISKISRKEYVAPGSKTEAVLTEICAGLLDVTQVGIHDDFFELGGHSLLAARLVSNIRSRFNLQLPVKDIFDYSVIEELSLHIDICLSNINHQEEPEEYLLNIEI
jgi:amino acid adenylation domain-containing protein